MLALLLRILQKHNYKLGNIKRDILKLIVNTLLDDGYIIKNVNTDLGIITAEKGFAIKEEEARNSSIWTDVILEAIIVLTLGIILLVSKDKKDSVDKRSSPPPQINNKEELYEKNKIIETTINVSEFSSGYKVRAVFQKKVLNNRGEITSIENIDDMKFYQDFFSKLDKSIFLQKELEMLCLVNDVKVNLGV